MEKKNEFTNEELAQAVRWDIIEMIYRAGMGHPGSSLSCVEILVALLFGRCNECGSAESRLAGER